METNSNSRIRVKAGARFAYALALYAGLSGTLISLQFFFANGVVYALFRALTLLPGPDKLLRVSATGYDALGFALLTVTNTVLQYYLSSRLARDLRAGLGLGFPAVDLAALLAILFFSCGLSAAVFLKVSARSAFGSYLLAALPLAASYLLGALPGLLQNEEDNPFRDSAINIFRLD